LNSIGQCYSPTDSSGNPVTFKCFSITYISPWAEANASLSAFKDAGCFARGTSDYQDYSDRQSIQYNNEKPFTLGSLSLYAK
jgi:hypothetical protein